MAKDDFNKHGGGHGDAARSEDVSSAPNTNDGVPGRSRPAAGDAAPRDSGEEARACALPETELVDVEVAASRVHVVDALRARVRRAFEKAPKGTTEVSLGGGITAFKFGRTWRFRFPTR